VINMNDNLILLCIAAFNLLTAFLAWRTHQETVKTQTDVRKIELATNSMQIALVTATGLASHAAGKEEGLAIGKAKAAAVLKESKGD
jgi:hypothetical protein